MVVDGPKIPANLRCCAVGRIALARPAETQDPLHDVDLQRFLRSGGHRPYASAHASSPFSSLSSSLALAASPAAADRARPGVTIRRAPSRATPPFYLEATVRPEGDLRDDALAAAGKVLRTHDPQAQDRRAGGEGVRRVRRPEGRLRARRRAVARREGRALGRRRRGNAEERLPRRARRDGRPTRTRRRRRSTAPSRAATRRFSERELRGRRLPGSTTTATRSAVVEGFAVFGTRGGVQAIDRRGRRATALEADKRYKEAIDELEDDRLAHLLRRHQGARRPGDQGQDPEAAAAARAVPSGCSTSTSSARRRRVLGRRRPAGARRRDRGGSGGRLLQELRRCWRARFDTAARRAARRLVGGARDRPKLGETVKAHLPASWPARSAARRSSSSCARSSGSTSQQDVFSWIGDVAFFVRGTSMDTVDGGVVIEVHRRGEGEGVVRQARRRCAQARGGARREAGRRSRAPTPRSRSRHAGAPKPVVAALATSAS